MNTVFQNKGKNQAVLALYLLNSSSPLSNPPAYSNDISLTDPRLGFHKSFRLSRLTLKVMLLVTFLPIIS